MWLLASLALAAPNVGGTWTVSNPAHVKSSIDAGVAASVAAFPSAYQSMVESKLSAIPEVCEAYVFTKTDTDLVWTCDDKPAFTVPLDKLGVPYDIKGRGKRAVATVTATDTTIQARFDGKDGTRTTVFEVNGDSLKATYTVRGPKLSVPLTWTAHYSR